MKIILLGAPGAGKGTQADDISERYSIVHVSTGDIFRKNIKEQTEIGKVAKSYIDKGNLVPDEVTVEIVKQRIAEPDCKNGYLLDGFPRNLYQAERLDEIDKIDYCVNLDVPEEKLIARLTGRRICSSCGKSFHVDFLNGSKVCDVCGGDLIQRSDDHISQVTERMTVYASQTKPLIDYYRKKGILVNVNADGDVKEIKERIKQAIKND